MEIRFIVEGKVQPKQRPRFRRAGNKVFTYTPKETTNYENLIKENFLSKCKNMGDYLGNVEMEIITRFKPPKSTSKKKFALLMNTPFLKKPDADNIVKSICDGLNGVAYNDDNQVSKIMVSKIYSEVDEVEVIIRYEEKEKE